MQAIGETIFDVVYLSLVITLGIKLLGRANGRAEIRLYGLMAVLLGCGDAFHLIPRVWALCADGLANHAAALGVGKLITSITMTVFYVLLYEIARRRYDLRSRALSVSVYALATVRIALCCFPQNDWLSATPPLDWGIARNIPFALLGIVLIVLYYREAKRTQDKPLRHLWLAVTLSFAFYLPVVLFSERVPAIGALMIPKTCAYVWIVWMGWTLSRGETKPA